MTLRAKAFHESIAVRELDELFRLAENQLWAKAVGTKCPKCPARFAVFFPDANDDDNPNYLSEVLKLIGDDCKKGKHNPKIQFTTTP